MLITYQLYIYLSADVNITIGRHGKYDFPDGYYLYTGSARKNLLQRVKRHLRDEKKVRWHIDYLLINSFTRIVAVRLSRLQECELNQMVGGTIPVPGFGASDCKKQGGSHLKYLGKTSNYWLFCRQTL